MKRQPWILAGSALGLLMASAPLGAYPLQGGNLSQALAPSAARPVIRIQAECPEGVSAEDCARAQNRRVRRGNDQGEGAAPSGEDDATERRRQRRERQQQQEESAPAEQTPETQAAPAEPESSPQEAPAEAEQPRRQRQQQAEPAPAQEPAPAEEPAPAPAEQAAPQQQEATPPSEAEQRPRRKRQQQQEQAQPQEEPAAEPPAEAQPAPAEEAVPTPEQRPAQAEQTPAQSDEPAEETAEPRNRREKLRDYLRKKQQGDETPTQAQPRQAPTEGEQAAPAQPQNAEEAAPAGEAQQETEPQLPAAQREQAIPKSSSEAEEPLPENAAPLPDSAKSAGEGAEDTGEQPRRTRQRARGEEPENLPRSDSAAQEAIERIDRIDSVEATEGRRIDRDRWQNERRERREEWRRREGGEVVRELDDRVIVRFGDRIYIERRDTNSRLERNARDSYVEVLPNNFTRYTIVKEDGVRVVTVRNADGEIVRRSRIMPDRREVVLYYVPESYYGRMRGGYYDAGADLPPLRLDIPADEYILDAERARPDDYYVYLDAPPVEPVERIYSVDEVVHSARIRDKVRRIDLDTITFDTGSAEIREDQLNSLEALGEAMNRILDQNPAETFLIEGHTDAVGSDESNLVLSDERAQAVAEALTTVFDIPAENLTTQGYGEQYLKVNTQGASQENRRVAVRRITPLVAPVASAQ